MDSEQRKALKELVDLAARERAERGYMDCDPESLTRRANEADEAGYPEVGQALRNFRDKVVNVLLGEGWDLNHIETTAYRVFSRSGKGSDAAK